VASTTGTVTARDGTSLLVRDWPAADPWVSMLLVHGLGEHSGRYEHVGAHLASAGIAVHSYDHRGFGGSGGERAYVDRWEQYHEDLEDRLATVRGGAGAAGAGDVPVVLYGHSMGALIALGYTLTERPKADLLVLSAPAIDSAIDPWRKAVARVLSRITPHATIANGIDGALLSRDPAVAERYISDPANWPRSTLRFGAFGLAEQARCRADLGRLHLPTLVIHGGDDALVPTAISERMAALLSVTRVVHPGLRHEMHNEPEWKEVLDGVVTWLKERAGGPGGLAGG
jgi:alpha-beta hydrolase superfamily lysophospholipase